MFDCSVLAVLGQSLFLGSNVPPQHGVIARRLVQSISVCNLKLDHVSELSEIRISLGRTLAHNLTSIRDEDLKNAP